jgi:hypothetical protein
MPTDDDDGLGYALMALAAMGLGFAAYGALSSEARRRAFKQALREALERNGIGFVDASLARVNGAPVWLITVNHPLHGVKKYRLKFSETTEPYSNATLNEVIGRLLNAMEPVRQWG